MTTLIPPDYAAWLAELKATIRTARLKAGLAVNRELVLLYWRIGKEILERQSAQGWGAKVIDQLARDLRAEFSDMRGFSRTNLLYMRAFASAWPEEAIVHQLGGQIPWRHNCVIIDQVKDRATREWYIRKTIENGWSRSVLELQIETAAHRRVGAAQTNFDRALPSPQSDLARDILKDPYTFDFLGITDASNERAIEKALLLRLRDFLIELGVGFAFVGSQYRLEVDGRNGCARLVVLPYSISHGSPISILGSSLCAMYGEAVLRASFHAGWPTLGGVPGRFLGYGKFPRALP